MLKRLALLVALISAPALAQSNLPTRVWIPAYIVSPSNDVADEITSWTNLLQGDMQALAGEMPGLANAQKIHIAGKRVVSTPTLQNIQDQWRQLNALQVITAIGTRNASKIAFEGSIYLGNLGPGVPGQTVPLPRTLAASTYAVSRDTIRAATLYALSVDAGNNRVVACELLHRAGQATHDLARRNSAPAGLSAAIAQRRSSLGCGITR